MQSSVRFAFLALSIAAGAALLTLLVGQKFGMLGPDEFVFLAKLNSFTAEDLWIGFFTPYFRALAPFVQSADILQDLPWIAFILRLLPLACLAWVAWLFWRMHQGGAASLAFALVLVLLFATVGRIVEIRPDGIAIPIIAGAWLLALCRLKRSALTSGFVLPFALLFFATLLTPRAIMFTALCAPLGLVFIRIALRLSWASIVSALAVSLISYALVALIFYADVEASLMSGMFERAFNQQEPELSLYTRFFFGHRGVFVAVYGLVIFFAMLGLLQKNQDRFDHACIATAIGLSLAQIFLLAIDNRPYEYAYGYGLAGPLALVLWLTHQPDRLRWFHFGFAAILMAWQVILVAATNMAGFNLSWIHVLPKALDHAFLERAELQQMMPLLAPREPMRLRDQHRLRLAICAQIGGGLVIAEERYQPFCNDGQNLRSFETGAFVGGVESISGSTRARMDNALNNTEADLLVVFWGPSGTSVGPFLAGYLHTEDWQIFDGFAFRR